MYSCLQLVMIHSATITNPAHWILGFKDGSSELLHSLLMERVLKRG